MFMFKTTVFLEQLNIHAHDIYQNCKDSIANTSIDLDFIRIDQDMFTKCRSELLIMH